MTLEEAVEKLQAGGEPIKTIASAMKDTDTMMAKIIVRDKVKPVLAVIVVRDDMCPPVLKVLEALDEIYDLE